MTDPTTDRYPCPDRRCPGLIPLDAGVEAESCHQCPKCHRPFPAKEIRAAPKFRQWKPEPRTNDNSHVQFWSQPIKRRLEQSTIGANQAAKRDLSRYHAIVDDALPAVRRWTAVSLVRHLMTRRAELAMPADVVDGWSYLVAGVAGIDPHSDDEIEAVHDLYQPDLLQKYALIDAADRCIKEYDDTPEPNLPDIVARHFRISPERS